MRRKNYKISRDNIYVGQVAIGEGLVHNYLDYEYLNIPAGKLGIIKPRALRTILFTPSRENFSQDLLYNTALYPVLNMTNDEVCKAYYRDSLMVDKAMNLGEMLAYYDFDERLSFEEVVEIRETFFDGKFADLHQDDFDVEGTEYGKHSASRAGYRFLLSRENYLALKELGDNSAYDVFTQYGIRMNSFKPNRREEGKIKKLKKLR